jgi:polysaccharide pyruvyl transferase CsaB
MRAVLCGYYGKGNGGDEALLATLLQMLPTHVKPLVLSGNPDETGLRYGVETCDRFSPLGVLQAFRQSEAFIWGGGSLMQDTTSLISPLYYGGLMGLAQQMGLRTIAWAQGIGPLNRSFTRWLTQTNLKHCTAVSVRDEGSAALLSSWKIPFTLSPDPVWALEAEAAPGLWDLPAPRVAIVLRPHPQFTPERLQIFTKALIDFQKATQTFVLLIPFQPIQDMEIAQTIHAQMPKVSKVLTLSNPHQLKGVFRGVEMTIAMRLHGLIMAAASECRCFAMSYDPKVSQLMQTLGVSGWEIEQMPLDAASLCREWIELYANGSSLSAPQISAIVDRALIHRDVLHQALALKTI